jgi:hypothetical protein
VSSLLLAGSYIAGSFNTGDSGGGIVEIQFTDNVILSGPGPDLVVFELSGEPPPSAQPRCLPVNILGLAARPSVGRTGMRWNLWEVGTVHRPSPLKPLPQSVLWYR